MIALYVSLGWVFRLGVRFILCKCGRVSAWKEEQNQFVLLWIFCMKNAKFMPKIQRRTLEWLGIQFSSLLFHFPAVQQLLFLWDVLLLFFCCSSFKGRTNLNKCHSMSNPKMLFKKIRAILIQLYNYFKSGLHGYSKIPQMEHRFYSVLFFKKKEHKKNNWVRISDSGVPILWKENAAKERRTNRVIEFRLGRIWTSWRANRLNHVDPPSSHRISFWDSAWQHVRSKRRLRHFKIC